MADNMQSTYKNLMNLAQVMQASFENDMVNFAYEARNLIEQSRKQVEKMMSNTHSQSSTLHSEVMEQRLQEVERMLHQLNQQVEQHLHHNPEPDLSLAGLEDRVTAIKYTVDQLTRRVSEPDERDATISSIRVRVANLENLLQKGSIIPQVVHRQAQAIVQLQDRIEELESAKDTPSIQE